MAARAEWADDRADPTDPTDPTDEVPVTPPPGEPDRPGVVTAAVVVWIVLGALMIGTALLFAVSLVTSSGGGPGPVPVILMMLAFAAAGVAVVLAARRAGTGSRTARRG